MAAVNRRARRLKLLVGAVVIAACVGYLIYGGIQETIVYFVTPSELHAKGSSAYGKSLRLGGLVKEGSWSKEAGTLFHRFELVDETSMVQVAFRGIPPDLFGDTTLLRHLPRDLFARTVPVGRVKDPTAAIDEGLQDCPDPLVLLRPGFPEGNLRERVGTA